MYVLERLSRNDWILSKGKEQQDECEKARERILKKNDGKLPKKYEHSTLQSCLYCPAFMES